MLRWAAIFMVMALVAALLGFVGVANLAWDGFKVLALIFVALAVLSFLGGSFRASSA